jgi:hypothetical protein
VRDGLRFHDNEPVRAVDCSTYSDGKVGHFDRGEWIVQPDPAKSLVREPGEVAVRSAAGEGAACRTLPPCADPIPSVLSHLDHSGA